MVPCCSTTVISMITIETIKNGILLTKLQTAAAIINFRKAELCTWSASNSTVGIFPCIWWSVLFQWGKQGLEKGLKCGLLDIRALAIGLYFSLFYWCIYVRTWSGLLGRSSMEYMVQYFLCEKKWKWDFTMVLMIDEICKIRGSPITKRCFRQKDHWVSQSLLTANQFVEWWLKCFALT